MTVFTSRDDEKGVSGGKASILGVGVDELFPHVRSLSGEGIAVVMAFFGALCILGGDPDLIGQENVSLRNGSRKEEEAMETDSPVSGEVEQNRSGNVDRQGIL